MEERDEIRPGDQVRINEDATIEAVIPPGGSRILGNCDPSRVQQYRGQEGIVLTAGMFSARILMTDGNCVFFFGIRWKTNVTKFPPATSSDGSIV